MLWWSTSSFPSACCFCGYHPNPGQQEQLLVPFCKRSCPHSPHSLLAPTWRHQNQAPSRVLSKLEPSVSLFLPLGGALCFCSLLLSWHTGVIFFFVLGELFYFYPSPFWVWLNNYFILNYLSWSNCMVSTFLTRPQLMWFITDDRTTENLTTLLILCLFWKTRRMYG